MKTTILVTLAAMMAFSGCIKDPLCVKGEGPVVTRILTLDPISSIELQGSFDVIIKQGEEQEVKAVGNDNIIDHLDTYMSDGTWYIGMEQGCFYNFDLKIYLTVPYIESIANSGSGDMHVEDFNDNGDLILDINGSGDINLWKFTGVENMTVTIGGSGSIVLNDSVEGLQNISVRNSGSGKYKGFEAETVNCTLFSNGSGYCEVTVSEYLDVTINGSGNVYYKGRPAIDVNDNGSGKLISRN